MRVVIAGATGFIGRPLCIVLDKRGDHVVALVRDPDRTRIIGAEERVVWDASREALETEAWVRAIDGADVVVNLAGSPAVGARWNDEVKREIRDSRVLGTRHIVDAIVQARVKPRVLINASGINVYGSTGDKVVDERDAVVEHGGFLGEVAKAWEHEAMRAEREAGVRVVCLRTGVVLGADGGALPKMVLAFKLYVGGPLGGPQYMPWVHLDDEVGAIVKAIDDESLRGAVNVVAPNPVRMSEFARELGRSLDRPSWFRVPPFALRIALGEGADAVLEGQNARPAALQRAGFAFRYPTLDPALHDLAMRLR